MDASNASAEAGEDSPPNGPLLERLGAWWRAQIEAMRRDPERAAYLGLVALAVLFNLVFLLPEVVSRPPDLNDTVFHVLNLERASDAILHLKDPTDPWLSPVGLGFPVFHYYQHLPYVLPALVHVGTTIDLDTLFNAISYLLLCAFPVSIFWSMRRMGFERAEASFAALASCLISTRGLYGFDFNSYLWSGYGLYTQLWGMVLLPPALALAYELARTGKGYFWPVLLVSAVVLSHLAFGYIAFGTMVLFVFLQPSRADIRRRGQRMLGLLALVGVTTAYFLVPLVLDSGFLNRSVWDTASKYDSYGAQQVLRWLVHGDLFDYDRLPVLTLLAALGVAICGLNWREERYRLSVGVAVLWLLLYFGRPTWGPLFDATPLGKDFYLHRLISGVHLGGILLIGIGLAAPWRAAMRLGDRRYLLGGAVLTVLVLLPVYHERVDYLDRNRTYIEETSAAFASEQADVDTILATIQSLPPGRVYAGLAGQWGRDYRVGAVPMHAVLTEAGIDNVGFLWHPWSLNGDIQVLFDESRPELYDLFNIRYVVAPDTRQFPDFVHLIGSVGRHRLYEVQTTGYFEFVSATVAVPANKGSFYYAASNWLASGAPALHLHPVLAFPGAGKPAVPTLSAPLTTDQYPPRVAGAVAPSVGRIVDELVEPGRYSALVEADAPGTVMLKVSYHPGWHVFVDGQQVQPVMLMPSYLGVPVGAGKHGVVFEYRGPATRPLLLLLTLATLVAIPLVERQPDELSAAVARLRERVRQLIEPVQTED